MSNAIAGLPWELALNVYDEENGNLLDPDSVQLDITYGQEIGFVPDVAGPFNYQGAQAPIQGEVWWLGTGQYACYWMVPDGIASGVYVANWTVQIGSDTFLTTENFYVAGGSGPIFPAGDVGYWTGGMIYPAAGLDIEFGTVDGDGIAWLWQKIEGWDGPDVQGAGVIAKSGDHGAYPSPQYYAARQLTLTVTASAPTQALRDLARAKLQQAVPVSDLATMRYDEPIPKTAQVRRSGKVTEAYPTLADVTFTIGLVAPDPRKYNAQVKTATVNSPAVTNIGLTLPFMLPTTLVAQAVAGSTVLTNAGNFETRPVVVITGPCTGPSLTNVSTGRTVSYSRVAIPAGGTLTVDFNAMQAVLASPAGTNSVYRSADPFSAWWDLPPGDSTVAFGGSADAGATAQFTWADAWI